MLGPLILSSQYEPDPRAFGLDPIPLSPYRQEWSWKILSWTVFWYNLVGIIPHGQEMLSRMCHAREVVFVIEASNRLFVISTRTLQQIFLTGSVSAKRLLTSSVLAMSFS